MKQKSGWWSGIVCCLLLACVVKGDEVEEGSDGTNGASKSQSTLEEGELLVTEIMADPQGADTGKEYIEIHNPTGAALSLKGLELFVIPDSTGKEKRFALPSREISPGAYLALGDVPSGNLPPHIDIGYDKALGALPNTKATVGLRKTGGAVIDSMHYESTKAGRALSRQCPHMTSQQCSNEEALWCFAEADTFYDGENYGSPQKPNAACKKDAEKPQENPQEKPQEKPGETPSSATCLENGVARTMRVPKPGQLILNEFMADPSAGLKDEEAEWVELLALAEVDLNGLVLATNSRSQKLDSDNCIPVKANAYFLLVRTAAPETNGCISQVGWPLTLSIPNSSTASNPQKLTLLLGEEELDAVTYPTAREARSFQRDADTQEWCYVPTNMPPYDVCRESLSGNRGTPGGDNISC